MSDMWWVVQILERVEELERQVAAASSEFRCERHPGVFVSWTAETPGCPLCAARREVDALRRELEPRGER